MARQLTRVLSILAAGMLACLPSPAPAGSRTDPSCTKTGGYKAIVSLAPSTTELIYSLGCQNRLVAVSANCDFPPPAKALPRAGSFLSANLEKIKQLAPDLILLVRGQEAIAHQLERQRYTVRILRTETLADIVINLQELGTLTGTQSEAKRLARDFQASLAELEQVLDKSTRRPSVLMAVWPLPLIVAGKASFLDQVITACGGTNSTASLPGAYPQLSLERLILIAPDAIFLPHQAATQDFWQKPPWTLLAAVKQRRVYLLPAEAEDSLFRPTLRLTAGLAWLATRLHPERKAAIAAWHARSCSRLAAATGRQVLP